MRIESAKFFAALALCGCAPTFLERAASEPHAVRLPTGNVLRTTSAGEGATPGVGDRVNVSWVAHFVDGKVFATAGATEVWLPSASPCLRDAVTHMRAGEKARLTCLPDSARGEEGPKVPADTTVWMEIELGGTTVPEIKLPPGLVLKTTKAGTGAHPRPSDRVKVNYEGRLADGKVFDSSIERGEPATFPLSDVIPCWRLALQKISVGEKATLICPPDVAYGKKGSPPSIPPNATLTFEVELLDIEK